MTIIHSSGWIFIKTRKTAGSSLEMALLPYLDSSRDEISTSLDAEPVPYPFFKTPNRTTRSQNLEPWIKTSLRKFGVHRMRLREHMSAERIIKHVGLTFWRRSYVFCVERDPWTRTLSLWRWRKRRFGVNISFEDFLRSIEKGSRLDLDRANARHWSNWPLYTINNQIVADQVIQYSRLQQSIETLCRDLKLPGTLELPWAKVTQGTDDYKLTADQVHRIADLFKDEIRAFDYTPPTFVE